MRLVWTMPRWRATADGAVRSAGMAGDGGMAPPVRLILLCSERSMDLSITSLVRGAIAGTAASVVQAAVGASESALMLPEHEDANIAPRLMDRLARDLGEDLPLEAEWILGTLFHLGYGATWGMLYALAEDELDLHPAIGGTALGALIYAITFPRWGVAVQTEVERPPQVRTRRMTIVAASVALSFGLATAYASHALRPRLLDRMEG